MPGDLRLKTTTRQAYGKKRKRPWNARQKASKKDMLPGSPVEPEKEDSAGTSFASHPGAPGVNASSVHVSGASKDRIDTVYYSVEESAECAANAANVKQRLASQSATERKFKLLDVNLVSDGDDSGTDFMIVDMSVINSFLGLMPCPECGAKTVTVSKAPGKEYGLCAKLVLACSTCDLREEQFSSPRVEVNVRAMKAIQSIGKGATALSDFFATMNISHRGLHHKTYQGHINVMVQACNATATECEAASVARIKELYKDMDSPPGNIDVVFDGTWLTRGHNSHVSVGCIIEMYTGLVIDHMVLSNFCLGCSTGPKPSEERYAAWLAKHTPECQKNIDCKSGRMEVEAALCMFRRSLDKHKLRYTTMLSDGDSRTFHALTEDAVYGFVKVEKKDCINHVHKRMGAALRGLVDKKKAQGEPLGGKGRLTQDKIKKITNYYGYALRSHKNDVPGMRRAVEATLQHMSSTDETPKHSLCPEGPESWCSYNRAMATNEGPPPHKNSLPDFVCEALQPVFTRLSDEALLKRCSDGMTQNSNESLHAMIWNHVPKSKHASLHRTQTGVAEGISRFNQGVTKSNKGMAEKLGYCAGSRLVRRSLEKDRRRLQRSNDDHRERNAVKTKLARRHKPARDSDYSPGLL
ncbi:unnamed protein product [Ixodes pacificus]